MQWPSKGSLATAAVVTSANKAAPGQTERTQKWSSQFLLETSTRAYKLSQLVKISTMVHVGWYIVKYISSKVPYQNPLEFCMHDFEATSTHHLPKSIV